MVRQAKGLKHCRNIKRKARRLWQASNLQDGLWEQCLKAAIELHRVEVEKIIRKRMAEQESRKQKELDFCDQNGWLGCC